MTIRCGGSIIAGCASSSVNPDNKSITTNSSDQIQSIGVINQNNTTSAIKTWTGTLAQYNAIINWYAWSSSTDTIYTLSDIPSLGDSVYDNTFTAINTVRNTGSGGTTISIKDDDLIIIYTRDSNEDIINKDANTLYNITDDASGTMNVYSKAEVDTLLNNKANTNLSNVETPHLISFETNGTQWCKTYSNGWREQFCVYSNIVSLNSFTNAGFTWQLYKPITTFVSGHATVGGNAAIIPGDVFSSSSTTEVIFWLHNASNGDVSNVTITGKFYVEGWI